MTGMRTPHYQAVSGFWPCIGQYRAVPSDDEPNHVLQDQYLYRSILIDTIWYPGTIQSKARYIANISSDRYNIDSHDYSVRLKAAQKFLKDGDKLATEETKNLRERNVFMVLMPNKVVLQKTQEQPKKKEKPVTEISASV
ncbi:hypothetical protein BHM03_00026076 [Ensete ventricosum]|nr:hypothetical protein BHM03_00026076 [Ensete ventricosum]